MRLRFNFVSLYQLACISSGHLSHSQVYLRKVDISILICTRLCQNHVKACIAIVSASNSSCIIPFLLFVSSLSSIHRCSISQLDQVCRIRSRNITVTVTCILGFRFLSQSAETLQTLTCVHKAAIVMRYSNSYPIVRCLASYPSPSVCTLVSFWFTAYAQACL